MHFIPERLISLRQSLGINKAEAARRLNISAMGYGRYESGEREPSYQTVAFIAQTLGSSIEYLSTGALFDLVQTLRNNQQLQERLLAYASKLMK